MLGNICNLIELFGNFRMEFSYCKITHLRIYFTFTINIFSLHVFDRGKLKVFYYYYVLMTWDLYKKWLTKPVTDRNKIF